MIRFTGQRFLVVYSGVLTLLFAVTLLTGFARSSDKLQVKEIDVQRVNIVEPDGTLRMVISDKTNFPGIFIKGKEHPHPDRKTAGILFLNDEGTENGGLTFGGYKDKDGKPVSYGHLSFDKYMQDQTLVLDASQHGDQYTKGLSIMDRPDYPITEILPLSKRLKGMSPAAREEALKEFASTHPMPVERLYLGRRKGDDVGITLRDKAGHARIVMRVNADGSPVLQFLDASGKVVSQLPAAKP
ncbi:MAG TPA: hypothetical protein VFK31_00110 [Rhodanobacteraceae bacterium]|nr:hypothetical protein [Rhodanobacteraceae bacterium]